MRITGMFLLALALATVAGAQTDGKIVIGKTDSLYSKILKEQRKVWIYTPEMTSGQPPSGHRYPVLYLLDGDAHFTSVVGLVQQLSQVNGNTVVPEMVVVAVHNTDRTRDLTPTHITGDSPMMDSASSVSTGGGENFISFLEKELIPHIDSVYPTAPYRILVGHSFGGLAVMNILTNRSALFNAFIAIDPSMWYDRQRFLAVSKAKLLEKRYTGKRLFVGIANTMPDGMTLAKLKKDTTTVTRHIRSILELDQFLKANPQNGLSYASRYYAEDNHGSVPLAAEYDGLRFLFNYYKFDFTSKDYRDTTVAPVMKFRKHYQTVSKEMGFPVYPNEGFINYLGYDAMNNKNFNKAAAYFKLNMESYPKSSNVYDSYGDLMAQQNDTVAAIENYKKALSIADNAATRQKLWFLQNKGGVRLTADELQPYTGVFQLEEFPVAVTLAVKEGTLWATVPGQEDSEMVPLAADTFTVKNKSGYLVTFRKEGEKVVGFTSVQPNGTFKAHRKQ